MIDCHCHLEQKDYEKNREEVIEKCRKELRAIVTCCAHPNDLELTLNLVEKYKGFVFATASIHPEYVKEVNEGEIRRYIEKIRENREKLVGIGEQGLDYYWIKEKEWREKQKEIFRMQIRLAKELNLPIVVHARDAFEDAIRILEEEDAKRVLMHMFGAHHLLKRIVDNGWLISLNTIILRSKKHKKIVRDVPIENLLTETDSPWLDPSGGVGTPLNVKFVLEKISEVKKIPLEKVDEITTLNAIKFFNLPIEF